MNFRNSAQNSRMNDIDLNKSSLNATIISEPGNFVKPLAHSSFGSENLSIICEGYQSV